MTDNPKMPKYPIYVPSKGRYEKCWTAEFLIRDGVPFYLVVEECEYEQYSKYGKERLLVLPFKNKGVEQLVAVRNWILDHSIANGDERHWQIDDNIKWLRRRYRGKRYKCNSGVALRATEDFVDRYTNVAVAGLNYAMFCPDKQRLPPFRLNAHVYSCTLILNGAGFRYRGPRNEDVDLCLQVLSAGWCTIQMNAFFCEKMETMTMKGGNTDIYDDDGRLKMSRVLEKRWPGVVSVFRRYGRPHHLVFDHWQRFDTPLEKKEGLNIEPKVNEYGLKMTVSDNVKSKRIQSVIKRHAKLYGKDSVVKKKKESEDSGKDQKLEG